MALLEKRAESLDIEIFHIYSYEELLQLIKSCGKNIPNEDKSSNILSAVTNLFHKDDTLLKIADIILDIN